MTQSHTSIDQATQEENIRTKVIELLPKYIDLIYNRNDGKAWFARLSSIAAQPKEVQAIVEETCFLEKNYAYIPKDSFAFGINVFLRELDCLYFLIEHLSNYLRTRDILHLANTMKLLNLNFQGTPYTPEVDLHLLLLQKMKKIYPFHKHLHLKLLY